MLSSSHAFIFWSRFAQEWTCPALFFRLLYWSRDLFSTNFPISIIIAISSKRPLLSTTHTSGTEGEEHVTKSLWGASKACTVFSVSVCVHACMLSQSQINLEQLPMTLNCKSQRIFLRFAIQITLKVSITTCACIHASRALRPVSIARACACVPACVRACVLL